MTTNATNISSNDTDITTANTNIATNATDIATLTNDLATANTDITQNASDVTSLTSTVTTNTTNIAGKPNIYRQAAAPAVTVPVGSIWYDSDDGNKLYVLVSGSPNVWTVTDNAGMATNSTAISTNATDIATLTNNLATTDTNVAQNATDVTSLTTDVTTNTTDIATNTGDITSANTNIATNATNITTLTNDLTTANTNITQNATNHTSLSSDVTTNTTDIATNGTDIATNGTNIGTANTNIATNATNITTLTNDLTTAEADITQNASDVTSLTSTVATNTSDIGTAQTDITTNATNITTLNTGLTTANTNIAANSTDITTLDTSVTNNGTNITANATSITNLSTTVGTNTTSITTNATSINGIQGKYGVTIDSNGALTGFELVGGGGSSIFKINADDFKIYNSGGDLNPFSVSGNRVQIDGDLNVSGAAIIGGTATANDLNGRPTALLLKNLGTVSTDAGSVCMELRSAARWHHVIQMNGYTNPNTNAFDLSAEYRLGKSVDAAGQNDNYSTIKMMLNGGGLIIPDSVVNGMDSSTSALTPDAAFTRGSNIFFNSNNASTSNFNYGRMHINEYYNTFFIDVPGGATHSSGSQTYDGMSWVMRKRKISSGTYYSSSIMKVDTSEVLHVAKIVDIDSTAHYLDPGNTTTSINVAGDIVAFSSSDKRLKDNIKPIENALDKVNKISGVTFEWNETSHKKTGKKDVGVIAQEIEAILPELVDNRLNGYKAVDYPKLTALLIEAVKDLSNQVKELKDGTTK